MEWFYYDDFGNPFDPTSYSPVTVPIKCTNPTRLCAIKAFRQILNGQPRPIITAPLQAEIAAAISTGNPSPNVLLKP